MTNAIRPPSGPTVCPNCEGDGVILVQVGPVTWYDDGLDHGDCPECGGTGQVHALEALLEPSLAELGAPHDTVPAPAPDGCADEVA